MRLALLLVTLILAGCGRVESNHVRMLNDGCTLKSRVVTGQSCYRSSCSDVITSTYSCPARDRSFTE